VVRQSGRGAGDRAATDAERDAATARLREQYAAGLLSLEEFQERLDAACLARGARELGAVAEGVRHEGVVIPPGSPWGSYPGGYPLDPAQLRAAVVRAGRRVAVAFGLLVAGGLAVLGLLITAFVVHGGLLAVVVGVLLAMVGVAVIAAGAVAWLSLWLWRRHAWVEAVPLVTGQPWLGGAARIARLLLTGRTLWRLRSRLASRA
jgi:hypothetical protein